MRVRNQHSKSEDKNQRSNRQDEAEETQRTATDSTQNLKSTQNMVIMDP